MQNYKVGRTLIFLIFLFLLGTQIDFGHLGHQRFFNEACEEQLGLKTVELGPH